MLIIAQHTNNAYFNIAAEEYLLKHFNDDIFRLYINEPSVIVGKHQNALAEANYKFVLKNNIPVIRRISGGGTVFHDLGNINFTFIANGREGHLVDFKRFTQPIIDVLCSLGLNAKLEGKNDIRVNGLKISGNAEHVYKNRILHHGTILVSANLKGLAESLKVFEGRYTDNAVKSIRSNVTNIGNQIGLNVNSLCNVITKQVLQQQTYVAEYSFSPADIYEINKLVETKYNTWEWNYAYSPNYILNTNIEVLNSLYKIKISVSKGIICNVESDNIDLPIFLNSLIGKAHNFNELNELCNRYKVNVWELL